MNKDFSKEDIYDFYYEIIDLILGEKHHHKHAIDDRIYTAIEMIKRDTTLLYSPETVSKDVFLSLSRFQHLFKEQTGTTLSRFSLWQRTLTAINYITQGHSFTKAAIEAGFSDGAHFSRMVKKTFGLTMSDMAANQDIKVITYK